MKSINSKGIQAAITAVSGYVPSEILSNSDLEQMVDTNDEWIVSRTGIKERRIARNPLEPTSFLAIQAANQLLQKKNIDPLTIDLVLVATVTPDMGVAATAAYVATQIGDGDNDASPISPSPETCDDEDEDEDDDDDEDEAEADMRDEAGQ